MTCQTDDAELERIANISGSGLRLGEVEGATAGRSGGVLITVAALWIKNGGCDTWRGTVDTWVAFRDSYNTIWLAERHGFITPETLRQTQFSANAKAA